MRLSISILHFQGWMNYCFSMAQVVQAHRVYLFLVWIAMSPKEFLVSFGRAGCLNQAKSAHCWWVPVPGPLSGWLTGIYVYIHTWVCISLLKYVLKTISSEEYLWFRYNTAGFCLCTCSLFSNIYHNPKHNGLISAHITIFDMSPTPSQPEVPPTELVITAVASRLRGGDFLPQC